MINQFRGEYRFLSNFYPSRIEYKGIVYNSVEAAYQAHKCPEMAEQFKHLDPAEAKKRGRLVRLRDGWDDMKLGIMEELLRLKFTPGSSVTERLLRTGDEELVEGNTWGDSYWGVDAVSGEGENHLGKLLMKIRASLGRGH